MTRSLGRLQVQQNEHLASVRRYRCENIKSWGITSDWKQAKMKSFVSLSGCGRSRRGRCPQRERSATVRKQVLSTNFLNLDDDDDGECAAQKQ